MRSFITMILAALVLVVTTTACTPSACVTASLAPDSHPGGAGVVGYFAPLTVDLQVSSAATCTGVAVVAATFPVATTDNRESGWSECSSLGESDRYDIYLDGTPDGFPGSPRDVDSEWSFADQVGDDCDTDGDGLSDSGEVMDEVRVSHPDVLTDPWELNPGKNQLLFFVDFSGGPSSADDDRVQIDLTDLRVWEGGRQAVVETSLPVEGGEIVF